MTRWLGLQYGMTRKRGPKRGGAPETTRLTAETAGPAARHSPSAGAADDVQPPPTVLRRVIRWAHRYSPLINLFVLLGAAGTALVTGKTYLDSEVDRQIARRLKLYEDAAVGWTLNQAEDHDDAVLRFVAATTDAGFRSAPLHTKNLIRDGLIYAAAWSTRPIRFQAQLNEIERSFGGDFEHTGWRHQQFGWFHLRSGNARAARQHFLDARRYFDLEREKRVGADASRGLMYVALAEGNLDEAVVFAKEAAARNPAAFDFASLARDLQGVQNDGWISDLKVLYPQTFPAAFDRLILVEPN